MEKNTVKAAHHNNYISCFFTLFGNVMKKIISFVTYVILLGKNIFHLFEAITLSKFFANGANYI